jgi:DNA-binding SARP family transcriptional activator
MTPANLVPDLLVRLVGPLAVRQMGRELAAVEVGNRRARRLLALLAVQRAQTVSIGRIVDALWDATPPRQPVANVATLVSRLRATLGTSVVVGDRRIGYRLGRDVRVDLHEAGDLVIEAEGRSASHQSTPALTAARQALNVLDESVALTDEWDADWAESARSLQTQLLRRARHITATVALDIGDTRTAVAAAQAAVAADRLDETAYRALMRAYHLLDEPAHALVTYERLRMTLAYELGIDPARATHDLYLAILRGKPTWHPPGKYM